MTSHTSRAQGLHSKWLLCLIVLLAISACGGDDNHSPTATRAAELTEVAAVVDAAAATETRAVEQTEVETIRADRTAEVVPTPVATVSVEGADSTQSPPSKPTAESTKVVATSKPDPIPTIPPTASPALPTTAPAPFVLGDKITFDNGATVQLYEVARPVEVADYRTLEPGTHMMAVDVEYCAGSVSADDLATSNYHSFTIVLSDNTRWEPTFGGRTPEMQVADLFAGDCNRGWVSFEIPESATLKQVVFNGEDYGQRGQITRWELSL